MASEKKETLSGLGNPLRILALLVAGMTGLYFSYQFVKSTEKCAAFHEINWNPREIIDSLVLKANAKVSAMSGVALNRDSILLKEEKDWVRKGFIIEDTAKKYDAAIDGRRSRLASLAFEKQQRQKEALDKISLLLRSQTDTAIANKVFRNSSLHIHAKDLSLDDYSYDTLADGSKILSPRFMVSYADASLANGFISDSVTLRITSYPATERFFNKYPGFALWSLLLIVQATLYFLLITGFIFHLLSKSANTLCGTYLSFKPARSFLIFAVIGAFLFAVYLILIFNKKGQTVPGKIFMDNLTGFFILVNIAGYLAAAFCITGMINCVLQMNQLKSKICDEAEKAKFTPEIVAEIRQDLTRRFTTYFVFTAIILSLAIFTTGTFYSAMNGMDFIKQISFDQGRSPVNTDTVYIYGLLNSFFLLIIYLPLKFIFNRLDRDTAPVGQEKQEGQKAGDQQDDKKTGIKSVLGKFQTTLSGMQNTLIAVSPFLASLLQDLLNAIFS